MRTVKKKQTKPFPIYPEVSVLKQLKQLAEKNHRSVNGEIMLAIEKHLTQQEQQAA
jgi:hypothetical protein